MNQDGEIGTKFTLLQKNNFKTGQHIWKDYFQDIGHQETMDSDIWESGNQSEPYDNTNLLLGENSPEGREES